MRFLLLARARATGHVRLLADRAFDSRAAAVQAATLTARNLDLDDDEVFAVDLDAAGPVVVLRVEKVHDDSGTPERSVAVVVPEAVPRRSGIFATYADESAGMNPPAKDAGSGESLCPEPADPGTNDPVVRFQPGLPLFGVDDDAAEDPSDILRRVARRMETDLAASSDDTWNRADGSWDARTLDEYAMPGDGHLHDVQEEGHLRIMAAELLQEYEAREGSDAAADPGSDGETVCADAADDHDADDVTGTAIDLSDDGADATTHVDDVRICLDESLSGESDDLPSLPAEAGAGSEAEAPQVFAESEPYRPGNVDFGLWVCADCVYQRTCGKAGVATPATCGNFLWR